MVEVVNYKGRLVNAMRLQGIGWMPSVPASTIEVGDELIWNYGSTYVVESVEQTSAKFLTVVERNAQTGKPYTRKLKVDRHVVARRNGQPLVS